MKPMTDEELEVLADQIKAVRTCLSYLRLTRLAPESEDIAVAVTRLDNWLTENDGRWVA